MSNQQTAIFHDELCLWHSTPGLFALVSPVGGWVQPPAGAGLAESPESKRRAISLLQVSSLKDVVKWRTAAQASETDLMRVHPESYLQEFKRVSDAGGGELGPFAPFGKGSYEIARLSAGLAIQAMDDVCSGVFKNAYSMSRPPGHHCTPDEPMGFCLLSNIAIGVEATLANHQHINKVAVLDWDVHHGNGTQAAFYGRNDVLTISIHQEGCFPPGYSGAEDRGEGEGEGYNINVPLLPGGGHDSYLSAMNKIAVPAIKAFDPDLIVVANGMDGNIYDPLARMLAYSDTYRALTEQTVALAAECCDHRLVVVHEGGYAESYVPFCTLAVIEGLLGQKSNVQDPELDMALAWQPNARFQALQTELLDELAAQVL